MKVIRIVKCSAGNDSVGEMWEETEIFDDTQPISDLFRNLPDQTNGKYIMLSVPRSEVDDCGKPKLSKI